MADTKNLKILGNTRKTNSIVDVQNDVDRITKEINKNLSDVKIPRETGINLNKINAITIPTNIPFNIGVLVTNVTIIDSNNDELEISGDGRAWTMPRLNFLGLYTNGQTTHPDGKWCIAFHSSGNGYVIIGNLVYSQETSIEVVQSQGTNVGANSVVFPATAPILQPINGQITVPTSGGLSYKVFVYG